MVILREATSVLHLQLMPSDILEKYRLEAKPMLPFDEDFVTVNPYLGTDGVKPFVDVCKETEKGYLRTGKNIQSEPAGNSRIRLVDGRPLYELVGEKVAEWGESHMGDSYSYVGAVVGATYPEMGKVLRKIMPKTYILVPGYGAQGGKAADLAHLLQ